MWINRTPTNSEMSMSALGFALVALGAIALTTAAVLILFAAPGRALSSLIIPSLIIPSVLAFFGGWELQNDKRTRTEDCTYIFVVGCVSLGACIFGGDNGRLFISAAGAIISILFVPMAAFKFFDDLRTWRRAEGSTSGRRNSYPVDLEPGVTCPWTPDYAQTFRQAEEIFDNARFKSPNSYRGPAQRAPVEWHFDQDGATVEVLNMFGNSLNRQPRREWDIFVMMVSRLPDEPDQPAVIVVTGPDLDLMVVDGAAITLKTVDFSGKFPASTIRGMVCYKW